ncbi:MAG TPA: hypothetical protein DIW47_14660 [Bacteroidetes bacterium]|nr:hypothetical protein [Bacteroidota bacterium]
MKTNKILYLLPLLCIMLLSATPTRMGEPQIDLAAFVRQTQIMKNSGNHIKLTWWIPTDYWEIALKDNPDVSPSQVSAIVSALEDYVLVCAANLESDGSGSLKKTSEADLRKGLSLLDENGKKYLPLEEDDIDAGALAIAGSVKPMFSKMLGDVGKGMHLYFFKVQSGGKNLIHAGEKGNFTIVHSETEFKWELPLPILMPAKICPVDQAEMQGNWNYCPIHGNKLD